MWGWLRQLLLHFSSSFVGYSKINSKTNTMHFVEVNINSLSVTFFLWRWSLPLKSWNVRQQSIFGTNVVHTLLTPCWKHSMYSIPACILQSAVMYFKCMGYFRVKVEELIRKSKVTGNCVCGWSTSETICGLLGQQIKKCFGRDKHFHFC